MKNAQKILLSLAIAGVTAQGWAVAFENGGFDTGDLTGWTMEFLENSQNPWQQTHMFDMNFNEPGGLSIAAGFCVGQVSNGDVRGGIRLFQELELQEGVTYNISYKWAARNTFPTFDNHDGGIFRLMVDGTELNTHDTQNIPTMITEHGTLAGQFNATTTGMYAVGAQVDRRFPPPFFGGDPFLFQYFDDFEIEPVPEPATLTLAALAGLLIRLKKKKGSQA